MSSKECRAAESGAFSLVVLALSAVACGSWTISFVCGYFRILAPAAFLCLVGGVLGTIGLVRAIFRDRVRRCFAYYAFAILLVLPPLYLQAAFFIGVRSRAAFERKQTSRHNMKILREAILSYTRTHDGELPEAESWSDSLVLANSSLAKRDFQHPVVADVVIAYNQHLSRLKLSEVAEDTVLFFEASGAWNLAGNRDLLEKKRNATRADIMLLNGKIQTYWIDRGGVRVYDDKFVPVRWKP
ncbi:MAG: hypothetical protein ACYSWQ_16450 [Planctomycetota bacterium]